MEYLLSRTSPPVTLLRNCPQKIAVEQGRHRRQDTGSADQGGTRPQIEGKQEQVNSLSGQAMGSRPTLFLWSEIFPQFIDAFSGVGVSILGKVGTYEKQNTHCARPKHLCDFRVFVRHCEFVVSPPPA